MNQGNGQQSMMLCYAGLFDVAAKFINCSYIGHYSSFSG
jgi:hypothetical protein